MRKTGRYPISGGADVLFGEEHGEVVIRNISNPYESWSGSVQAALAKEDGQSGALEWIRQKGRLSCLIDDLTASEKPIWDFPRTWEQICSGHNPADELYGPNSKRDKAGDFRIILASLQGTPKARIAHGVRVFTDRLRSWEEFLELDSGTVELWFLLMDAAEAATEKESHAELMVPASVTNDEDDRDVNLNVKNHYSPIGNLAGVFIAILPNLNVDPNPFIEGGSLFRMRARLLACTGPARNIVQFRFSEQLSYLLLADPAWTNGTLIDPLRSGATAFRDLWVALSYRPIFKNTLESIGDAIIDRCSDPLLSRQVRENLVLSVVVECLRAYHENHRQPAISKSRVVQMLRSLDDEARARAAGVLGRFIREVSDHESGPDLTISAESLVDASVMPFLAELWPKERSLSTPEVAKALADLPAASRGRFAHADRPVFPYELGEALSQIDPSLEDDPRFLRLSMLMHRG